MSIVPDLSPLAALCAVLYALAALRLLCYRRPKGARHRPLISLLACLLIASLSCRAVALITWAGVYPLDGMTSTAVCGAALAIRGNLAILLPRGQCPRS